MAHVSRFLFPGSDDVTQARGAERRRLHTQQDGEDSHRGTNCPPDFLPSSQSSKGDFTILTLILQKKVGREKLSKFSRGWRGSDGARIQKLVALVKVHGPSTTLVESSENNQFD